VKKKLGTKLLRRTWIRLFLGREIRTEDSQDRWESWGRRVQNCSGGGVRTWLQLVGRFCTKRAGQGVFGWAASKKPSLNEQETEVLTRVRYRRGSLSEGDGEYRGSRERIFVRRTEYVQKKGGSVRASPLGVLVQGNWTPLPPCQKRESIAETREPERED